MPDNFNEQKDKEQILKLVSEYCNKYHKKADYVEGQRIPYASRVYDHSEMTNLVDSSLEFWLTSGRYTDKFENDFAKYLNIKYAGYYNVGPDECDCITTGTLVDIFCEKWAQNITWEDKFVGGPHEANFLKLDCSKIKKVVGWSPRWNVEAAIERTVEWAKCYFEQNDINECMNKQIIEFFKDGE